MHKRIKKILFVLAVIILCNLYVNSATWFRLKLADYYAKKQDDAKLIAIYKKIIRKEGITPQYRRLNSKDYSDVHFALANLYFKKRNLTEAVDILKKLHEIASAYKCYPFSVAPPNSEDYKKAGICLLRTGFIDMTVLQLEQHLRLRSGDSLGHYQLGLMYLRKNDDNSAAKEFQKAIDTYDRSSFSPEYLSDAYLRLAEILKKNGDLDKAIGYYNEAVRLKDNNFQAYLQLRRFYKESGKNAELAEIEGKIALLKPDYVINHRFNDVVFVGYCLNKAEFELFNEGEAVFVWDAQARAARPNGLSNTTFLTKIGDMIYEIKQVKNLAPDFGFEMDLPGAGFPCGWDSDYYNASFGAHQIVSDIEPNGKTQCLMLTNLREDQTNCQSAYIGLDDGYYLQSGMIKSIGGNAYFGSRWYTKDMHLLPYDYVETDIKSPAWQYYFRICNIASDVGYCRVLLTNSQTKGKAYFDDVAFFRLDLL